MLQATVNVGACFAGLPWETLFSNAGNDLHGEFRVRFFCLKWINCTNLGHLATPSELRSAYGFAAGVSVSFGFLIVDKVSTLKRL
jgi:hypothetical protein